MDKAMYYLNLARGLYEDWIAPEIALFYAGFRIFAEIAQVKRHEGEFELSITFINKSLGIARQLGVNQYISWVLMVRVGILTESISLGSLEKNNIRRIIKADLDEISQLTGSDSHVYEVAHYQYLKSSHRLKDRIKAENIIEHLLADPGQHWIHKIDARQHLAILLVEEYKLYEADDVLEEAIEQLNIIEQHALQRDSLLFFGKARLILGKLKEVEGELDEAVILYKDTLKIARENKMGMLIKQVQESQKLLDENFDKMQQLIRENASIEKRMELNKFQQYISLARSLTEDIHE